MSDYLPSQLTFEYDLHLESDVCELSHEHLLRDHAILQKMYDALKSDHEAQTEMYEALKLEHWMLKQTLEKQMNLGSPRAPQSLGSSSEKQELREVLVPLTDNRFLVHRPQIGPR